MTGSSRRCEGGRGHAEFLPNGQHGGGDPLIEEAKKNQAYLWGPNPFSSLVSGRESREGQEKNHPSRRPSTRPRRRR